MDTKGKGKDYEEIISTTDVNTILDQYHIGKKPLAKLLGWGETTVIRYIEGDIPSREYSSKLQMLLDEPVYYYDLLTKRKSHITDVAYRKSRRAVLSRILSSKIYAMAYYFINKSNGEISTEFIQYLLYYCQAFSLSLYDKEIFQEDFIVDSKDKPYPKLYKSLKTNGISTIDIKDYGISEGDLELMEAVYFAFSWYGSRALQALAEYEKPFLRLSYDDNDNRIISKDTIRVYFRDIVYQYNIHETSDIYKYPDRRLRSIKNKEI